ncbi:MAG: UTP--glucose-1-phosphate uridylyltransferase [Planctomycetia bacterium]|nr:UTP--glucose-1-phosphate uridylyltransferase [Planctomycetia bacterium]
MQTKEQLLKKLRPLGQTQLLTFWDELDSEQQQSLSLQIEEIDFDELNALFEHRNDPPASAAMADRAKEPVSFRLSDTREQILPLDDRLYKDYQYNPNEAIAAGEKALRNGKLAIVVVAGGQGTRLDFHHAKGIFPIGPVSGVSLFQIHIERIRAMSKKYGARIPFCIQTSPATHQETIDYFRANHNFGLAEEDVLIFCQSTMPSVDWNDGKVLLAAKDRIARSPDGHGGMLFAINSPQPDSPIPTVAEKGILAELIRRQKEEIFYFQVDNPVIDICSPEFIGYHLLSGSEFSSQVIRKQHPQDRVGNMVLVDGKLNVIEYCDLPDEAAQRRKPDGSLEIWAGSIAVHMMNIDFLRRKASYSSSLPFHIAKKKVPYVVLDPTLKNENGIPLYGSVLKPKTPNAIKYEKFIFDLLPQAKNPIVIEVDIQTCFAPLKNHPDQPTDNPQTVRKQLCDLYRLWLNNIGIRVADNVLVEISPLFANSAKELKQQLEKRSMIPDSGVIEQSVYWQ